MGNDWASDDELLAGLRARDEDAFAELLARYDGLLRRVARRFVATDSVAAEVVGETWLAVVKGIDRFEGRSSLKTWLLRILSNQAMTRGAKEARTIPLASLVRDDGPDHGGFPESAFRAGEPWTGHWSSGAHLGSWGSEPLDELVGREMLTVIRDAADALPDAQRRVFALRDVEGLSTEEVAETLDLSLGNTRVLLHRARSKIRVAVDEYAAGSRVQ